MPKQPSIGPYEANPIQADAYAESSRVTRRLFHELSKQGLHLMLVLHNRSEGSTHGARLRLHNRARACFVGAQAILAEDADYTKLQENVTFARLRSYVNSAKDLDAATVKALSNFDKQD